MNGFAHGIDVVLVIRGQGFIECNTKNYVVGQRDLLASDVDGTQIGIDVSPLAGAKQDGFGFFRIQGQAIICTEPDMQGVNATVKVVNVDGDREMNNWVSSAHRRIQAVKSSERYRERYSEHSH